MRSPKLCAALICALASAALASSTGGRAIQEQNDAAALNARGLELFKEGKYEEAIKAYKSALKLRKDYAEAHLNLGDVYFAWRDYKKAIESYKQALRYQAGTVPIFNKTGLAYQRLGENKKAIEAFNEAIRLDPKNISAHFNLGATYASRDREKEALDEYQVLKTLDPALAKSLWILIYRPVAPVFAPGGVRLNFLAADDHDNPVANLSQEDFQVFDDDVPQTITFFSKEQFPVVYGVAIDSSGSMRPAFNDSLKLAKAIIQSSRPEDEVFVERFVDSAKIETVQEFTSDKDTIYKGLDTLYVEGGQSAIIDAVYLAAQHTAEYKIDNANYLRRVVVLITDGDERASYYTTDRLVTVLRQVDVQIYAICISKPEGGGSRLNQLLKPSAESFLITLAKETGGWVFFPKTVSELSAVTQQLTAMIRAEYLVAYKPATPGTAGTYHRVHVALTKQIGRENVKAVARSGYVVRDPTPLPPP